MNSLFLLMLTINPATQSDNLYAASNSIFDIDSVKVLVSLFTIELPITKNQ